MAGSEPRVPARCAGEQRQRQSPLPGGSSTQPVHRARRPLPDDILLGQLLGAQRCIDSDFIDAFDLVQRLSKLDKPPIHHNTKTTIIENRDNIRKKPILNFKK